MLRKRQMHLKSFYMYYNNSFVTNIRILRNWLIQLLHSTIEYDYDDE